MSNIYKDGVEVHCPAVYLSDSATEALEIISQEVADAANQAYDAYGDGINISKEEFVEYLLSLEDDD